MQTAQLSKKKNSITKNIYLNMNGYTCIAPHELNIPGKIRILLCSYSLGVVEVYENG